MREAGTADKELRRLPSGPRRRWRFCGIELNESSLELRVGGQLVSLERKPLQVLLLLLHRSNEVVLKEDLFRIVWRRQVMRDATLTKCVAILRRALGDGERRIIRTVHGYGYRLVVPVS